MRNETTQSFAMQKLSLLREEPNLQDDQIHLAWQRSQAARLPARPSFSRPNLSRLSFSKAFWPLAAAGLAGVFLLTSSGRATAEALWRSFTLTSVQNVSIDFSKTTFNLLLPNIFPLTPADQNRTQHANTATEASQLANFPVRSLQTPLLPFQPSFKVTEEPEIRRKIDLAAMRTELEQKGRSLPPLPVGIDGAEIRLQPGSKSVISFYGECPQLVGPWKACASLTQSRPYTLQLPPRLSLEEYIPFSLELAGFSKQQTESLTKLHAKQATLFLPLETESELRQVRVRGTTGTLVIYPKADSGETAFVLGWLEDGFYFQIFGRNPNHAVEMAETLR